MKDDLVQAYGHLTAHDFLLELLYANWFAQISETDEQEIVATLQKRMKNLSAPADAKQDVAEASGLQIARDASVLLERFLQKAQVRSASIRAESTQE